MFDKYEAVELLQSLLRLARNENHQKADEYAAALDEIKTRSDFVNDQQLQRLFLGLLGDPVRAKVAKDANAILKGVGKVPPPPMPVRPGSTMRRPALCLNFGPSSELGVNEGVVPLLLVYFRVFSIIKFLPFPYRVLFHFIPELVLLLLLPVISRV